MSKLPRNVKPSKMVRMIKKLGLIEIKSRGGHKDFKHPDGRRTMIAVHAKPIPVGTLRKILNQIKVTPEEITKLLLF